MGGSTHRAFTLLSCVSLWNGSFHCLDKILLALSGVSKMATGPIGELCVCFFFFF